MIGKAKTVSVSSCRMYSACEKLSAHKLTHCPMSFHNAQGRPSGDQLQTSAGTLTGCGLTSGASGRNGRTRWASCAGTATWKSLKQVMNKRTDENRNGRRWRSAAPENRNRSMPVALAQLGDVHWGGGA